MALGRCATACAWIIAGLAVVATVLVKQIAKPLSASEYPVFDTTLGGASNEDLRKLRRIGEGVVHGPETVVFDSKGNMYGLTADGDVVRITVLPDNTVSVDRYVHIGGRPLGGAFDNNDDMYIADALKGLLRVRKHSAQLGVVEVLASTVDGSPIRYADDVAIGRQTKNVYFSDATDIGVDRVVGSPDEWDTLQGSITDALRGEKRGRLLRYNPTNGSTDVLLDGIWFANGVAVSPDESYVLVCETFMARILRVWLDGPRKGLSEIFSNGFPGYCDGISIDESGKYVYAAIPSPKPPTQNAIQAMPVPIATFLRNALLALPIHIRSKIIKKVSQGCVLVIDARSGRVLRALNDEGGIVSGMITAVTPRNGKLYLGSLTNDFVAVLDAPVI